MKRHIVEIETDDKNYIWQSPELASLLHYLKKENKLLGLISLNNDLKIVETDDFFDVKLFNLFRNNSTIILDRNLLIASRNIYDNGFASDKVDRFFLQVLSYAMFTDSILDPTIAIYEGGDGKFISAKEDLIKMRIVDNLPIASVLQLLFGEIEKIPNKTFNKVKRAIKPIEKEYLKKDFNKQLNMFRRNYPYFLKATLLLRQKNLSFIEKFRQFTQWTYEQYISMNIPYLIVFHSLFYRGGILKNIQDTNKEKLMKNIQNATWDATMLAYLKDRSRRNIGRYYLMATNDNRLVEVMRYCYSPDNEIEGLYGKNENEIKSLISLNNENCNQEDRTKLVLERLNNLDKLIEDLEGEL